jgi:hypothetical protein
MFSYFYYRVALEGERDELAKRMSEMTRAEEIIREKISEKQAEQEAKQAEMDEFAEIKVNKNKDTHSNSRVGKTRRDLRTTRNRKRGNSSHQGENRTRV